MQETTTTTTRTVVTEQPMVGQSRTIVIRGATGDRDWSSGLCECMKDLKSCLFAFVCAPCYECFLATRAKESCCIPLFVPGGIVAVRTKIRTQEHIRGSICDDCLKLVFCPCCTMAQMGRELDHIDNKL